MTDKRRYGVIEVRQINADTERAYERARVDKGEEPISKTRRGLKVLRSHELKCLETNAFRNERPDGAGDGVSNEELLRTFINCHHLPRLKAMIVHGSKARDHWCRLKLKLPNDVQYYFWPHLIYVSHEDIDKVGQAIKRQTMPS